MSDRVKLSETPLAESTSGVEFAVIKDGVNMRLSMARLLLRLIPNGPTIEEAAEAAVLEATGVASSARDSAVNARNTSLEARDIALQARLWIEDALAEALAARDAAVGVAGAAPAARASELAAADSAASANADRLAAEAARSDAVSQRLLSQAASEASAASAQVAAAVAATPLQIGTLNIYTSPAPEQPEMILHRGGADLAPENTMPAFTLAASLGATVEMDVMMSSDGVPVCHHNDTVDATTNGTGLLVEKTAAELRALDAGFKWNPAGLAVKPYLGTPIPFWSEVCALARRTGARLIPEIKSYRTIDDIAIMLAVARAEGVADQVEWQCNTTEATFCRNIDPNCALCITASSVSGSTISYLAARTGRRAVAARHDWLMANPSIVQTCRSYGITVAAWTVPTFEVAQDLASIGVMRWMSDKYLWGAS